MRGTGGTLGSVIYTEIVATRLLDAYDHRIRPDKVLNSRLTETCFLHPCDAICSRVVGPAWCLDEHVQAHQETEGIGSPLIVDDRIVSDECAPFRNGLICFADQHLLLFNVPVMENVTHHDHVHVR